MQKPRELTQVKSLCDQLQQAHCSFLTHSLSKMQQNECK